MKSTPAFQFYPQDFLVGTADMTPDEVGGYIRLLCHQWSKNGLPNDDKRLRILSGVSDEYSLNVIKSKFKVCEDGLLRNDRLESTRSEQNDYRENQRKKIQDYWDRKKAETESKEHTVVHTTEYTTAVPMNIPSIIPESFPSPSPSPKIDNTIRKKPKKVFIPPTVDQVVEYFLFKGYSEFSARKAFDYYDVADWVDASGNPVLSWKQKMNGVWFKPENEISKSVAPAPMQPRGEDVLYKHAMDNIAKYGKGNGE
jgi:uncharacterized protein YdaU (DUF1376 family)